MLLLPYEELTYKTHLSKDEILKRLSNETESKQLIRIGSIFGGHKEYEGTINENSFEISRIISYRNSFLPRIKGEIEERKEATFVHIKMSLSTWVMIFLPIVAVILFTINSITSFLRSPFAQVESEFITGLSSYMPFLIGVLFYVIITFSFKLESFGSKRFFKGLLEAEKLNDKKI
ncbi:hypothetical protein ACE193_20235 [Bernardetia sp. OM2101]|uniref:hypothetical protein n=1 Tax=Bernardetia sp. OM2101 TaxID=3344876 RepID=UPI0035CE8783